MKLNFVYCFLLLIFLCSSCNSYKQVPYFQDVNHNAPSEETINNYSPLKIQVNDIISIHVSSQNLEAATAFNSSAGTTGNENSSNTQTLGYKVNEKGEITLPILNTVKVAGLTTDEVASQLTNSLLPYFKAPVVNVRLLNFKVSVIGDVLKPDMFSVPNEHINVFQALSLAGDLNITAKRKNVLLIREQDGKRQYFPIDLTKKEVFNQPYYNLRNNDILYVEPDKTKYATVDRGYRAATLVLSAFSAIAIVISALVIQRR